MPSIPVNVGPYGAAISAEIIQAFVGPRGPAGSGEGGEGGATNLSYTPQSSNGVVSSDTGSDAVIPASSASYAGLMLPAEKLKLAATAPAATANAPDAQLRDRATHTGTQPAATISDATAAGLALLTAADAAAQRIALGVTTGGGEGGAVASVAGRTGDVVLTKADVGLSSVDNTPDASKPVSTAQAAAIAARQAPRVVAVAYAAIATINADTTDAASIAAATGAMRVDISGTPTNFQTIKFEVRQDATGGRAITLGSMFALPDDLSAVPWSTAANKGTLIVAVYLASRSKWAIVSAMPGV